jgi:2-succinyl-5-enolpyruvyl-6-hydroxy-3-cyclohexene-1-carboxylate synthase
VVFVVLNNDGGGIFHFLPLAAARDAFEEHVATPHGLDVGRIAGLFGCAHERPADLAAFRAALDGALTSDRTTIVEVRTDREENLALHRRVADAVAAALR